MKNCKTVLFFLCIVLPFMAFASSKEEDLRNKMLADIDIIKNTFSVKYAPAQWKREFADWNLEMEIQKAKAKVLALNDPTVRTYQHILRQFFNSARDYHVGIYFHATETAGLAFGMHSTNGRYFVQWIDPLGLLATSVNNPEKWNKGDEIITIDGRPVDEVIQEFRMKEFGDNAQLTDQRLAELLFTCRVASKGMEVPFGPVTVGVIHTGDTKPTEYLMNWYYIPEQISNGFHASFPRKKISSLTDSSLFAREMKTPLCDFLRKGSLYVRHAMAENDDEEPKDDDDDEDDHFLGSKKGVLPYLGQVLWEAPKENHFSAYLCTLDSGNNIGYVRIPSFSLPKYDFEEAVSDFKEIISFFEENSDALVIDQMDNPGGNLLYLYALTSMLTDHCLQTPCDQEMITQAQIAMALSFLHELSSIENDEDARTLLEPFMEGFTPTLEITQKMCNYFRFLLSEWKAKRYLTRPIALLGIDAVPPHPEVQYTKPILLLINELDFSCGDYFPAIMQDNNRAILMGTRTAGAGGYVLGNEYPNLFGIAGYTITASIAERVIKQPIENLGVSPDIPYQLTERDLKEGYVDYADAIRAALNDMLGDNS